MMLDQPMSFVRYLSENRPPLGAGVHQTLGTLHVLRELTEVDMFSTYCCIPYPFFTSECRWYILGVIDCPSLELLLLFGKIC